MILLIDNYDSFTYNLYQQLMSFGQKVAVFENDKISLEEISLMDFSGIVISPGPKDPKSSGVCIPLMESYCREKAVLGVCLGHQCIGTMFGVEVVSAKKILHGKTSEVFHTGERLFKDVPDPAVFARYHSLAISDVPEGFVKDAWTDDGEIMAISHQEFPLFGIQFHPESFMSLDGDKIIKNFLDVCS